MSNLTFKNIEKVYPGGCRAVDDFSLDIQDGEFMVFTGPDGSGKSTILRMVAGLEDPTSGEILIGGKSMNDVPSKNRDVALVLPDYTLYPHLSVYDNLAFGLKHRKFAKEYIEVKVNAVAEILGLKDHLQRKPKVLNTLQRLRVALGRVIVREPKVILFDEPLSNLDEKLRLQMRSELVKLHTRLGFTFLYATHDPVEAMSLSTRVAVFKEGALQQVDIPQNLYDYPVNRYVAESFGSPAMNLFDACIVRNEGKMFVQIGENRLELPQNMIERITHIDEYVNTGKKVIFGIRPEDLALSEGAEFTQLTAKVEAVETLGSELILTCELDGKEPKKSVVGSSSQLIARANSRANVSAGETVKLTVDRNRIHLLDGYTGLSMLARDADYKVIPAFAAGAAFVPKAEQKTQTDKTFKDKKHRK